MLIVGQRLNLKKIYRAETSSMYDANLCLADMPQRRYIKKPLVARRIRCFILDSSLVFGTLLFAFEGPASVGRPEIDLACVGSSILLSSRLVHLENDNPGPPV